MKIKMTKVCERCIQEFEWETSYKFPDVECPHCKLLYTMEYDEWYNEATEDDEFAFWLIVKE